jgi:hypothetical protein
MAGEAINAANATLKPSPARVAAVIAITPLFYLVP